MRCRNRTVGERPFATQTDDGRRRTSIRTGAALRKRVGNRRDASRALHFTIPQPGYCFSFCFFTSTNPTTSANTSIFDTHQMQSLIINNHHRYIKIINIQTTYNSLHPTYHTVNKSTLFFFLNLFCLYANYSFPIHLPSRHYTYPKLRH